MRSDNSAPADRSGPAARVPAVVAAVLLGAVSILGLEFLAAADPAAAAVSSSPSAPAASTPAAPQASASPSTNAPATVTAVDTPTPTPVSSSVTETTTATRRPLPGWAIAVVAVLAVGGAVAAYPVTRGR